MRDRDREQMLARLAEFEADDVVIAGEWVAGYTPAGEFTPSFLQRRKDRYSAVLVPFEGLERVEDR